MTEAVKLFETTDRDASHKKLEEVLKEGSYPSATCTEDSGSGKYYVWSEPPFKSAANTETPAKPSVVISGRIDACEKEIQEVLERHACVLEIRTLLVNGIVAESAIVAVEKK